MNNKEAILLFSGGRDSFLAGCYLMEEKYKIYMVTFENGVGLGAHNAEHGAKRIIKRYGKNRAEFLGVHSVAGIWREFILPYFNLKPSEISKEYGELTISQFHCLTCRSAMYIWSAIKAKQMGIKYIADGARKDQGFVIELPNMIEGFKKMFLEYSIELLLPVWDLDSDWERKNLLLLRGFIPKTLEPQCLIGVSLPDGIMPDKEIQKAVRKYFDKIVLPRGRKLITTQPKAFLNQGGIL
ncbi:conserved hypothetical protein [Candidatus Zixiibacteriota bacterium]|nr:conserved hypothetical protein [candidate division Zixibacteria bacterium]